MDGVTYRNHCEANCRDIVSFIKDLYPILFFTINHKLFKNQKRLSIFLTPILNVEFQIENELKVYTFYHPNKAIVFKNNPKEKYLGEKKIEI